MTTYQFMKLPSNKRNKNVKIRVWKTEEGTTRRLGDKHRNTAGWKGKSAVAEKIIAEEEGYEFEGYGLKNEELNLQELYTGDIN